MKFILLVSLMLVFSLALLPACSGSDDTASLEDQQEIVESIAEDAEEAANELKEEAEDVDEEVDAILEDL